MRALRACVAIAGDLPIMIDSGFRRGTDMLKALALGAAFVFVGRPFNYAAALARDEGVRHALTLLAVQLRADLGRLGLAGLDQLSSDSLFLDGFRDPPVQPRHDVDNPRCIKQANVLT